MRRVALSLRQPQNVRSVRPGLVVDELPNNAMEPSARELTPARRGSSRTLDRFETMATYYCHNCAAQLGYLRQVPAGKVVASSYQLDKYLKHTLPSLSHELQSVFETPSTQTYRDYILDALAARSIEIDDHGSANVIWVAGAQAESPRVNNLTVRSRRSC